MSKEKHENSMHSKAHHVQQAGLEETKLPVQGDDSMLQRHPLIQQISRMGNIPNPGAHAAILNRTRANQLSSNRQLVLQLQRQYGNSYVQRVMQQMQHTRELVPPASTLQPLVQAKLTIGEPGDKYELEADKVARQVVQQINAPASVESAQSQTVQRQAKEEEELMMKPVVQLQANTQMTAAPDLEASINQARGSGQPLADNIREPMEQAFGADFSGVKVHTDARADQLNQSIQAKAFTTGQDVFFRQGVYQPGSRGGQELIAHELTHVVQQNGGAIVQRTPDSTEKAKGEDYVNNVKKLVDTISEHIPRFSDYAEITTALSVINTERPNAAVMSSEVTGVDQNQQDYGNYVEAIKTLLKKLFKDEGLLEETNLSFFNKQRKYLVRTLNNYFDNLPNIAVDPRVAVVIDNVGSNDAQRAKAALDNALMSLANAMKHQIYVLLPVK